MRCIRTYGLNNFIMNYVVSTWLEYVWRTLPVKFPLVYGLSPKIDQTYHFVNLNIKYGSSWLNAGRNFHNSLSFAKKAKTKYFFFCTKILSSPRYLTNLWVSIGKNPAPGDHDYESDDEISFLRLTNLILESESRLLGICNGFQWFLISIVIIN